MKKAFDQTVRDLKREVNKKVLKVPGIEQKILDATSNESWGPHGSLLADLAQATRNHHEYHMIMTVIWKRINDTGKNWRHVYKALIVLEYLVAHGSERVIDESKEHAYQISTLADFQYIDSSGRDQGSNVRRKSQSLVALVNNRERIQEVREKALANKERFHSSTSGAYRSGSHSGSGDYGDHYDDDRFRGHYESRDADRNGYGRERDWGYRDDDRYSRGVDPYNRDGDQYRRDSDERYGRDSYKDDEHRGNHGTDDYQFGSSNRRSTDRYTERSFDDDDHYTSRHGVRRADDLSEDERQLEHRLSRQNVGAPPSYEVATRESQNHCQHDRNEGNVEAPQEKESSSSPPKPALPPDDRSQSLDQASIGVPAAVLNEVNGFDEFDPRGSIPGALPSAASPEMDFLGSLSASDSINSLTMMPVSSSSTPEVNPMNSGPEMIYGAQSMASPVSGESYENPFGDVPFKANPQDNSMAQSQNLALVSSFQPSSTVTYGAQTLQSEVPKPFEDPFGDTPFKGTQQDSFTAQPQNVASDSSLQLSSGTTSGAQPLQSEVPKAEAVPSFDFGDTLGGLTYTPTITNGQQTPADQGFLHPELPGAQASCYPLGAFMPHTGPSALVSSHGTQPVAPTYVQTAQSNLLPQSGFLTHAPPAAPSTNIQTDLLNLLPQSGLSATQHPSVSTTSSAGQLTSNQPSKAKFEPKSAVWADTLSRGLVDLNISGPKTNPLADIGVDFDSINRMDKRKEKKTSTAPVTSTITMGKAMGAGSGMGRAGSSSLAPPPNPMMGSGMNMGIGGGIGMGMGGGMGMGMAVYGGNMSQPMGMGMGMNMGMGMGMGMGRGTNMGMGQGAPMQPPVGMPPPNPGMPGVGYNPMMGTGGYGSQQPYEGGGYR